MKLNLAGLDHVQSVPELVEIAASELGITITVSREPGLEMCTGIAVRLESHALVFVREEDPQFYQDHAICHELVHLLVGRQCSGAPDSLVDAALGGVLLEPARLSPRSLWRRWGRVSAAKERTATEFEREVEATALDLGRRMLRNRAADRWVLG